MTAEDQELTVDHIEAARSDLAAEVTAILAGVRGRPASTTRTTVRINVPEGIVLPDGGRLTVVRVHRTRTADGQVIDQAEGLVGTEFRRLPVSLVPALISRAGA